MELVGGEKRTGKEICLLRMAEICWQCYLRSSTELCLSVRYPASALCFLLQNRICRFCLENKAYGQDWKCWLLSTREEGRDCSSTGKQGKNMVSNRNADSAPSKKGNLSPSGWEATVWRPGKSCYLESRDRDLLERSGTDWINYRSTEGSSKRK